MPDSDVLAKQPTTFVCEVCGKRVKGHLVARLQINISADPVNHCGDSALLRPGCGAPQPDIEALTLKMRDEMRRRGLVPPDAEFVPAGPKH